MIDFRSNFFRTIEIKWKTISIFIDRSIPGFIPLSSSNFAREIRALLFFFFMKYSRILAFLEKIFLKILSRRTLPSSRDFPPFNLSPSSNIIHDSSVSL